MDFAVLAEGLGFPEGPVMLDDGSVIVCEIAAGRVSRVRRDGSRQTIATPGGGPNGAAIGPDGALWLCNNGGFAWSETDGLMIPGRAATDYVTGRIERVDLATGRVERVVEEVDGVRLSGPNDLVFDADGGLWFTDLGKHFDHHTDHGGLFWMAPGGGVCRAAVRGPNLNGVGLSPDGTTVYAAVTVMGDLLAFDVTGPGQVAPPAFEALPGRVVARFGPRVLLDSLALLADGRIAQATLVAAPGIAVVDPATGSFDITPFPDLLTTNIAFGGADMRDAAVCLSSTGRLVLARWPDPGLRLHFNA